MTWLFLMVLAFVLGYFLGSELAQLKTIDRMNNMERDRNFWHQIASKQTKELRKPLEPPEELGLKWNPRSRDLC